MWKYILLVSFFLFNTIYLKAQDVYQSLANELSKYTEGIKKIAVVPFSYADNVQSTKDGAVIAERLSIKLINLGKFEVIERTQLDKVLQELKLQSSGVIDATSAKELGKILGVDAIITGTLVPTSDGKIEVNARIVKTDTAQAIGAAQIYVIKDWIGGDIQVQKDFQSQNIPKQQPLITQSKSKNKYSFIDILLGFGSQKMRLMSDDNVYLPFPGLLGNWSEITDIKTEGIGPIGIRMGGFGEGIVGGDFEFSVFKHKTSKQKISWSNGQILTMPEGFINVTSFDFSGDLLFRTLTKTQLYFGFGFGFSLNKITSTWLKTYDNKGYIDELSFGLLWRIPIGIRLNMDKTTVFFEWRYQGHWTTFDRGNYGKESHDINISATRFCFGIGSKF
ncbi:MAG: CsgG/HfaB family protein [Elusimicrobiales bacterium]|nr:CsgG/HfaB family protein [Elusimicrobiales bacterium]